MILHVIVYNPTLAINIMATNQQCVFILNNKSNCSRLRTQKYNGLCKYHFEKLDEKEQEGILLEANKKLQAKAKELKAIRAAEKAKTTIIAKTESELEVLEDFNYAKAQWEEERLSLQKATKKVLEDHQRLVLLTTVQARDIEELKEQLAVAKELSKAQQQNIDSHLKITDVIKREIERASRR